mgnify:CR=1 FL=1
MNAGAPEHTRSAMLSQAGATEIGRVLTIAENTLTFSISFSAAQSVVDGFDASAFMLIFSVSAGLYVAMRATQTATQYVERYGAKAAKGGIVLDTTDQIKLELAKLVVFLLQRGTTLAVQFVSNFVANVLKATVVTTEAPGVTALVAVLGLVLVYVSKLAVVGAQQQ